MEDTDQDLGNNCGTSVFVGAYIGGKYYFSKTIGLLAEVGSIGSTNRTTLMNV